jgi:ATP-dependent DNA helicase RecQ
MRTRLFTLRYSESLGGFDETPLREFQRDREIVAFREHFFVVHEVPHLLCVLTYQDPVLTATGEATDTAASGMRDPGATRRATTPQGRGGGRDALAGLDESQRVLFHTLREWRRETAYQEGVPPFLIFSNRQLVELVTRRPESPNALQQIPGIGPAKVKRHGKAVLKLLHGDTSAADGGQDGQTTVVSMESPKAEEEEAGSTRAVRS